MTRYSLPFVKGHGTKNDFIILEDPQAHIDLTPDLIRFLCDRRAGIGADGVLRVAKTGALVTAQVLENKPEGVNSDDWFMDYRNSDGSLAHMCGNGVRVLAHYLRAVGLVDSNQFSVGTRAGARSVDIVQYANNSAIVQVDMGMPKILGQATVQVPVAQEGIITLSGTIVDVGNLHLACQIPAEISLDTLILSSEPIYDQDTFPAGVNIEFYELIRQKDPSSMLTATMRVYERGAGETYSCGTGIIATAVAIAHEHKLDSGNFETDIQVSVRGGVVQTHLTPVTSFLTGPSQLVARGTVDVDTVIAPEQVIGSNLDCLQSLSSTGLEGA